MATRNVFELGMQVAQFHYVHLVRERVYPHRPEMIWRRDADRTIMESGYGVSNPGSGPGAFFGTIRLKTLKHEFMAAGYPLA
jgi:hypothetical protein